MICIAKEDLDFEHFSLILHSFVKATKNNEKLFNTFLICDKVSKVFDSMHSNWDFSVLILLVSLLSILNTISDLSSDK